MRKQRAFLSLVLLLLSVAVRAVPLPSGDTALPGTNLTARPELAGVVLEDVLVRYNFSGAGTSVSGVVQNRVSRSTRDGTLEFSWRIIPDATSTGSISALRVGGLGALALDGDWRADGLGNQAPHTARNLGNGSVNFLFDSPGNPGVGPTESSRFFFLRTGARSYDRSGQYDLLCANSGCISPQ
jgi:hypothetical protein